VQPVDRIRENLKQRLYRTIDEFEKDMRDMFSEWLERNSPKKNAGEGHRFYRTAVAIQDRFLKSMQKAHEKLAEFEEKARSRLHVQSQASQLSQE
jgi:hypothetical protein